MPLTIHSLTFNFGNKTVLKDIDFSMKSGDITALVGPNGVGKTTLLQLIAGMLPLPAAESGTRITVGGHSLHSDTEAAKASQQLVTDNPEVYPYLTGREFLQLHASLRDLPTRSVDRAISEIANRFPGSLPLDEPLRDQSRGTRQKVQIVSAFMTEPTVLLFDEPIVGLDPASVTVLGELIEDRIKGDSPIQAVLLALHTLSFAQEYADNVVVLHQGHVSDTIPLKNRDIHSIYKEQTA